MSNIKEKAAAIFDERETTMEMTKSSDPVSIVSFLDGWCLSESTVNSIQAKTHRHLAVRELKHGIKQYLLTLDERETNVLDVLKHIIEAFEEARAGQCLVNLLREKLDHLTASKLQMELVDSFVASNVEFEIQNCSNLDHNLVGLNSAREKGILLAGGAADDALQSMEFYSVSTNTSHVLDTTMREKRWGHVGGLLTDRRLMLAGGWNKDSGTLSTTEFIDLDHFEVSSGPPMIQAQHRASSAMLNGHFYVAGGDSAFNSIFGSCQMFRDGKWQSVSDMQVARYLHALVAVGNHMFAIGGEGYGWFGRKTLDSVERYSPETNRWHGVKNANYKRLDFSAAELNGLIYAAGGVGEGFVCEATSICERFDPIANRWQRMADMKVPRQGFNLVSVDGKLYALGGFGELASKSVEVYNVQGDKWKLVGNLCRKRNGSAAVVASC